MAKEAGERSGIQVMRYVRLTELIPELLDMVDEKKIAFNPAYELSFLKPDEQQMLVETMDYEQATPSLSQAQRMKKFSQDGKLSEDVMLAIDVYNRQSYISFVFQDVTLFNDTVMNNIRLGNPNATDDQVIAAAKAAYCDEFVREMPDGYQTVLGENGSTLSGGERQRISIARALLKNAPIILLDEATASLDPENEVLVQKAIAKLVEGKTVIMIAHRLRTVVDADQIIVLDNGKLVECGTHDELMKKKGLYHKLFYIQQESLGWAV